MSLANKTCVVKFTANWCGPCKRIQPLCSECSLKTGIEVFIVDVSNPGEYSDYIEEFKVSSIPHLAFLNNGVAVEHVIGADEEKIQKAFSNLKKKVNQIVLPRHEQATIKYAGR